MAGSGDTWALIQGVQSVIETIHTTTGLPWWATLAVRMKYTQWTGISVLTELTGVLDRTANWTQATGVTFRAAVFPLYVYQIKATQRLMQAKPDFSKLYSAYKYARTFLVRSCCCLWKVTLWRLTDHMRHFSHRTTTPDTLTRFCSAEKASR